MSKITVLYHSADFDGIFCREIARKFLGMEGVQYIGWNFGDPPIALPINGEFVIMDLPFNKPFGLHFNENQLSLLREDGTVFSICSAIDWGKFTWIDHHKSSIALTPSYIPGYRIDGVAACRLAWQWFSSRQLGYSSPSDDTSCERLMPVKQEFLDRKVSEPLAVRLAGEYDVAGPNANEEALDFQFGLRSTEIAGDEEQLLSIGDFGDKLVREISERGQIVRCYNDRADLLTVQSAFTMDFEGHRWLAINSYRANTKAFRNACTEKHDGILSFCWRGKYWTVSLYDSPHRQDIDLSIIAKKYGGGGHAKACGFECKTLPFQL